ncbi:MAG: glycosyltransferase family 4 protein [Myxococcota bacterium]|nr:glycosyltransferase family 4 protein [Myxococcota bacterium]
MKRVALVVPGFEEGGGVPAVALFLARIMRDTGRYEPEFISPVMNSSDPLGVRLLSPRSWLRGVRSERATCHGEPYTRIGACGSELEFQRLRPRAALTELLSGFDLVQIVAGGPAWGWLARDVSVPTAMQVATLAAVERRAVLGEGSVPQRAWRSLMTRITTWLEARGLDGVDAVFVENQWMDDHLREQIGSERVIFAPPGVDTDRFRPSESAQEPPGPGVVLCVGRLADPRKRVDLLFEAYAGLCARLEDPPRLLLAGGSAPPEASWARARELGVLERIEFRADVPGDELVELYRNASVFALASDEEGLGIVIVEAMACGLPVVTTDCGGPSTSVLDGETGILVPRNDPEAMASALHSLFTDPAQRARMARSARARATEVFSLKAAGQHFIDWYDRTLA